MKTYEFKYSILQHQKLKTTKIMTEMKKVPIAKGDGMGPEIMDATLE